MENSLINFDDNKTIATLKQTVAQGLTNEEFTLFAQFCRSTGLNPFKKEIWAIKAGGRLQLMTGIAGYWAIANSHPQFDGVEQSVEVDDKKQVFSVTTKVYRKDRKFPSIGIALLSEYKKGSPIWNSMPSVMLTKCSESVALRKAFSQELNGMYTEEEMPASFSPPKESAPVVEEKPKEIETKYYIPEVTKEQASFLNKVGAKYQEDDDIWISPRNLGEKLSKYELKDSFEPVTFETDTIPE